MRAEAQLRIWGLGPLLGLLRQINKRFYRISIRVQLGQFSELASLLGVLLVLVMYFFCGGGDLERDPSLVFRALQV